MNSKEKQILKHNAVLYEKGNFPVIISVPHGGQLTKFEDLVLERRNRAAPPGYDPDGPKWVTIPDIRTISLARRLVDQIVQRTGLRPYVVQANFHRKVCDVNRSLEMGVPNNPANRYVWNLYHQKINEAIDDIRRYQSVLGLPHVRNPKIMLLDIHGQCLKSGDYQVYVGTLGGQTLNSYQLGDLRTRFMDMFQANLRSFLSMDTDPATVGLVYPRENEKYTGGYIVRHHGLNNSDVMAIQLEFGRVLRREYCQPTVSESFGQAFANFLKFHAELKAFIRYNTSVLDIKY